MSEELVEVDQKAIAAHAEAATEWNWAVENTYKISNVDEYVHGAALLAQSKAMAKTIIADFQPAKKKAFETHSTICTTEKKHLKPLSDAEKYIKGEMVRFKIEQDQLDIKNDAFLSTVPEIEGIEMRITWTFEIENESVIPREFLSPDATKLKEHAKKFKESSPVKGVRFLPKTTIAVRSQE